MAGDKFVTTRTQPDKRGAALLLQFVCWNQRQIRQLIRIVFQVETFDHLDQHLAFFFAGRVEWYLQILERRMRSLEGQVDKKGLFAFGVDK